MLKVICTKEITDVLDCSITQNEGHIAIGRLRTANLLSDNFVEIFYQNKLLFHGEVISPAIKHNTAGYQYDLCSLYQLAEFSLPFNPHLSHHPLEAVAKIWHFTKDGELQLADWLFGKKIVHIADDAIIDLKSKNLFSHLARIDCSVEAKWFAHITGEEDVWPGSVDSFNQLGLLKHLKQTGYSLLKGELNLKRTIQEKISNTKTQERYFYDGKLQIAWRHNIPVQSKLNFSIHNRGESLRNKQLHFKLQNINYAGLNFFQTSDGKAAISHILSICRSHFVHSMRNREIILKIPLKNALEIDTDTQVFLRNQSNGKVIARTLDFTKNIAILRLGIASHKDIQIKEQNLLVPELGLPAIVEELTVENPGHEQFKFLQHSANYQKTLADHPTKINLKLRDLNQKLNHESKIDDYEIYTID